MKGGEQTKMEEVEFYATETFGSTGSYYCIAESISLLILWHSPLGRSWNKTLMDLLLPATMSVYLCRTAVQVKGLSEKIWNAATI